MATEKKNGNISLKKGNIMNKLYIMIGCPGSGKSTYAHYMLTQNSDIKYISRDEIRFSLISEHEQYFSKEKQVFKTFVNKINQAVNSGYDVIADATHLNQASRSKLFNNLRIDKSKTKVIGIVMRTPLDECIRRNNLRAGTRACVPEYELFNMYNAFQMPLYNEHYGIFSEIRIIETGE